MILTIFVVFVSLLGLLILHEFGHFYLAKRFGVEVEEFGIGYPPRLFGKKFGETLYSINLIPFGAFVKIHGEEGGIEDYRSFSEKPFWQRSLIVLGGVLSFWIVSAVLLSIVMGLGVPTEIGDNDNRSFVNPKVQVVAVSPKSPAKKAGIKIGDTISFLKLRTGVKSIKVDKVKTIQEFTKANQGKDVILTIKRGRKVINVGLVPRVNPPKGEGAIGVALVRTAIVKYPWWKAPIEGTKSCISLTANISIGLFETVDRLIQGRGLPPGTQLMGPVGIVALMGQVAQLGINYYLQFIAVISIYLAIFNVLPIPALDGGKLLFLIIEKIKGSPINQKLEQNVTVFFFSLLIVLMLFVTFKDIQRLL